MTRMTIAVALALALFSSQSATAHDTFMDKRFGAWTLVNGHWGSGDDAYTMSSLANIAAHTATGDEAGIETEERMDHVAFLPEQGAAVLAGSYISGFWSKDSNGTWHNKPANEVEGAKLSVESYRHVVAVIDHATTFKPFGLPVEILPRADPLALKAGDRLPVLVLLEGKPFADTDILSIIPGTEPVKTDANGRAEWTVRNGLNILAVKHSVKNPVPEKARLLNNAASLSFMVPDSPH